MAKKDYVLVFRRLEWSFSSWDGGKGLQKTRAWREPCRLFSESSGLHHGSDIPPLRAGEIRDVNERCLSSSLHNQFITLSQNACNIKRFNQKEVFVRTWSWPMGEGVQLQSHTSTHRQQTDSVAAEHAEGDLADDPVPRQCFRQHAHHKADHGHAAIEELCPLETLTANLSCCSALEPVVVRSRRSHHSLSDCEILRSL